MTVNPVINLGYKHVAIADGSTTTSAANGTDFGTASLTGSPVIESFLITNASTSPLVLGNLTIGGADPADFTVASQITSSVAPGSTGGFAIQFNPLADGTRTAIVSFTQDDATQANPFTFAVSGTGTGTIPSYSASVAFETTDSSGNVLTSVPVGTNFQLLAIVQDTSGHGSTGGVFQAYVDGSYDPTLASIPSDASAPVATFGPEFISGLNENTQTPGSLTDIGGYSGYQARGSAPQFTLVQIPVTTTAAGTETFTPSFAAGVQWEFIEYGDDSPLAASQITFVPASINITSGSQSAIAVSGDGQPIADGSTTPSTAEGTEFGDAFVGGAPVTQTFTITNSGTAPLTVGNVSLGGANAGDFTVTSQPAASVAPGANATFNVQFQPTGAGERDAILSFDEDDPTQASPFTFAISGAGLAPAIGVSGDGQPIGDGSATPSAAEGTDLGASLLGGTPVTQTYTITNSGTAPLTVGNVSFGGANAGDFTVTGQPADFVAPGANTSFTVQFQPTALGTRLATVGFGDNDPTQANPFTFAIQGEALPGLSITNTQVTVPDDPAQTVAAVFTVNLSASSSQTVTVNFATVDGTAVAGADYQATSGTLTFSPGTTSQTISVVVNGTLYANPTKQYSVTLSQPGGAIVTGATGTGSIVNNNVPTWSNPINADDVNGDGIVTPIDALAVINYVNSNGSGVDPTPPDGQHKFLDTNKDGFVTPVDALLVINQLDGVAQAAKAAGASSLSTATAGSAAVANSATVTSPAAGATAAAVVASPASTSQLVDLAFAVYNGEDLSLAGSALSGWFGQGGAGRRPIR